MKRRYVYDEDYEFIMKWGEKENVKTPNMKANFPYWLSEFIKRFKR